jgi:murein endopeptidase
MRLRRPDGVVDEIGRTVCRLDNTGRRTRYLSKGVGYWRKPGNEFWALPKVVAAVQEVGREFHQQERTPFWVIDMGKEWGGRHGKHLTHRCGLDLDIRPVQKKFENAGLTYGSSNYDREATGVLVDLFFRHGAEVILFNDGDLKTTRGAVTPATNHHNHLHVHFPRRWLLEL